jgi:hypothetical protein
MARDYPKAPWNSAWVDVIEGGCLLRAGRTAEARVELERGTPEVLKSWKPESLYGARATELLAQARRAGREHR